MTDAALTADQRQVLQTIYDRFRDKGKWPAFSLVDRELRRAGIVDPLAIMDSIPQNMLVRYRPGFGQPAPNDQLRLRLKGISQCAGSTDDVNNFVRLLPWLAKKELDFEPPFDDTGALPKVTSDEAREYLGFPDDADDSLARLYEILQLEQWGMGGGGQHPDGRWQFWIRRDVARFANVSQLDDYLAINAQTDEQARPAYNPTPKLHPSKSEDVRLKEAEIGNSFFGQFLLDGTSPVDDQRLALAEREWVIGELINEGGFGKVYAARSGDIDAVVKLVPKAAGAQRELLFADLDGVRNIVPIIDKGETPEFWALVMPRAEMSLRQHFESIAGPLPESDAVAILRDVAVALHDLDGRVVHRDLKPDNILFLNGHWCITDFGIARYAEATTALDTRKFAMTPQYAAPEQWKNERASSAADIYAFGIIAYELLSGNLPFSGPGIDDFCDQHLHHEAPPLNGISTLLADLVTQCLYKASGSRPSADNVLARLTRGVTRVKSPGLQKLEAVNHAEVIRQGESHRAVSEMQSEADRLKDLQRASEQSLAKVIGDLESAITQGATQAIHTSDRDGGWAIRFNSCELRFTPATTSPMNPWGGPGRVAFTVVSHAALSIKVPANQDGYEGRSHSLWYCDAQEAGIFQWYETAFMHFALSAVSPSLEPFALPPSPLSAVALGNIMGGHQVAWPFTAIQPGVSDDFIDCWAGWFADAAQGQLRRPTTMPERSPGGSWRKA